MNDHEHPESRRSADEERLPPAARVRDEDLEPFAALRYIARLFKVLATILVILLVAEIALGLMQAGTGALVNLLVSATRLLVFAGLLWGAGDIALMLIESNHDLRATRILVARLYNQVARLSGAPANRGAGEMRRDRGEADRPAGEVRSGAGETASELRSGTGETARELRRGSSGGEAEGR